MTTIALVRHGETDWNVAGILQGQKDVPLNEKGKRQAEQCGRYLKSFQWDIIITSPLRRAKQTAEIIQKQIGIPIVEKAEFMEKGYGDVEGLNPEERDAKFPDKVYPNQEASGEFLSRVTTGVRRIHYDYQGKQVILVTHGDIIHAILQEISEDVYGSEVMNLHNASVSCIECKQGVWKINTYNEVGHLSAFLKQDCKRPLT